MFQAVTRKRLPENTIEYAGMAELADALDSGSSRGSSVKVQVLLPAPLKALKTLRFRGFSLLNFLGRHVTNVYLYYNTILDFFIKHGIIT